MGKKAQNAAGARASARDKHTFRDSDRSQTLPRLCVRNRIEEILFFEIKFLFCHVFDYLRIRPPWISGIMDDAENDRPGFSKQWRVRIFTCFAFCMVLCYVLCCPRCPSLFCLYLSCIHSAYIFVLASTQKSMSTRFLTPCRIVSMMYVFQKCITPSLATLASQVTADPFTQHQFLSHYALKGGRMRALGADAFHRPNERLVAITVEAVGRP